jgi:hypothetical protein
VRRDFSGLPRLRGPDEPSATPVPPTCGRPWDGTHAALPNPLTIELFARGPEPARVRERPLWRG